MRLSPRRVATSIVMASWTGLFWFLIVSGRTSLYLSARTDWVVPVGAGIMTLALIGRDRVVSRLEALARFLAAPPG